ncbi:hypothetical protein FLAV_00404 [Flavobacteriales bacterium]|nr:T9SS C-terminal target domain-containing protein [Bacteroidota bacterium]MBV6461994.1 hypothetical protein [Flavobacteriales bacterium]CAG0955251.1 hypothetical protein FLAV_00404 [Flavobacteriales bacterium]
MISMIKKSVFPLVLFISSFCYAQEFITDSLFSNAFLYNYFKTYLEPLQNQSDTVVEPSPFLTPLELPFFDDFSQSNGFPYPDGKKWKNRNVFINSTYPVNPINIGVATFDGLKENGLPYNNSTQTAWGIADYLTSLPIDLSVVLPNDSVYFTFYFQPQGLGNAPETKDSLVLEFYNATDSSWHWRWSAAGSSLKSFKQVHLYVDTLFYDSHFQFRFRNYATLSGNVDHWHLDHVYLNQGRTYNDTSFNDVAVMHISTSLLDKYYAMPWRHYKADTSANMRLSTAMRIRNNSAVTQNVFYRFKINDETNTQQGIHPSAPGNFFIINPYQIYSLTLPILDNPFTFHFPAGNTNCQTYFPVYQYFHLGSGPDFSIRNDTSLYFQHFGNYYAYDDGSAEAAWGVQGAGTKVALEFTPEIADTLSGVDLYFNPYVTNTTNFIFRLTVWSSLIPEVKLYEENVVSYPQYGNINYFHRYHFSSPIVVNGTFYIGWSKISEDPLNVGFDYNLLNNNKLWYNAGQGWTTSSFQGSAMIRPVFGSCNDVFTGEENVETVNRKVSVFPNPANDYINVVTSEKEELFIQIFDVTGKIVIAQSFKQYISINVNHLHNGIMLLRITDNMGNVYATERMVIAK